MPACSGPSPASNTTRTAGDARANLRVGYWDEPWAIDAPAAEQNLTRRLQRSRPIEVTDPVVITLDDDKIWQYPWLYIVEPSNLVLNEKDVATLREHLLRGGTLTLDDFHGPYEWDLTVRQLKLIFPGSRDRRDRAAAPDLYVLLQARQVSAGARASARSSQGRTWEKGGFVPHLRGILDDTGRPMVLINWNTDMGDGVEWSNAEDYPGLSSSGPRMAYQMMINEVIYSAHALIPGPDP